MGKRLVSVFMALLLTVTCFTFLTGCQEDNTVVVGVSIYQYSDNFMALYRDQLIEDFEKQGKADGKNYQLVLTNGNNDPIEQANQINTFIAMDVDLIILNPVLTSSCNALLDKITRAGIPCILINREPLGENGEESYERITQNGNVAYVGCKASQSGQMQGEIIFSLDDHGDINGDGVLDYILIKGDPENSDARLRTLYSIGSCENGEYNRENAQYVHLCKEEGVSIEPKAVMDDQLANWDQAKAEELVTNALNITGNKIEVIFCNNDSMALGALTAVKKQALVPGKDVYIVGVDGMESVLDKIRSNEIMGTVKNDQIAQSAKTLAVAMHFLNGGVTDNFPHEEGKSEVSEKKGYYWVDYRKVEPER